MSKLQETGERIGCFLFVLLELLGFGTLLYLISKYIIIPLVSRFVAPLFSQHIVPVFSEFSRYIISVFSDDVIPAVATGFSNYLVPFLILVIGVVAFAGVTWGGFKTITSYIRSLRENIFK